MAILYTTHKVKIIFGFIATLYVVSCREHRLNHSNNRDNGRLRRYKDTKNKRGAGDYPFGLSFGGPSFSAFQSLSPVSTGSPFGFGGFGGFAGSSSLGINPSSYGISTSSPSFSSLRSSGLGNLGSYSSLAQPFNIGQGSAYMLSGSGLNLANLLGGQGSSVANLLGNQGSSGTSFSSPNIGLFSSSDIQKTGPVTFTAQSNSNSQAPQYTPVYTTATQLGSNSYSSPTVLSSSQGHNIQAYSQPSTVAVNPLLGNNGVMYSSPSSPSSSSSAADLASHAVSSNYVVATPQSTQSYSVPLSAIASSSSPTYSITIPASYGTSSTNSASPSSSSIYQLSLSPSTYSTSPLSSASNEFTKYIPISSDGSTYLNKGPTNTYRLSTYSSPSMVYQSSSKATGPQTASTGINYGPSSGSTQSVTSYGTPVMMLTIPSTSYGTPSQHTSNSNSQYTSSSSRNTNPSLGYAAAVSYSNPSVISSSSSHSTDALPKDPTNSYGSSSYTSSNSNYGSSATSYTSSNSNYGSASNPVESNSISGYKIQSPSSTSSLSNSIENYSSGSQSNTHDSGTDSSNSYSNHAPRYIRYPIDRPSPYIDNEEEESVGSSYDTISYSVPSK
ncbi:uncharacterized protein LOC131667587 [Phymastichus coffea]|uniref:uncharacterized protein LOC131667587 n=1 Tax=Phymastichus coffea TaxID=108790 RepID=UPI00273B33C8|nr:uncharacterized protein LOC131667587 [Phymastichus coffea]